MTDERSRGDLASDAPSAIALVVDDGMTLPTEAIAS
jgi:hypothetical protein